MAEIVRPTIAAMAARGAPFRGVLYAGLMITADGPKLIEYNVRFGDPETQVLMMRLDSDLLELLCATVDGRLAEVHAALERRRGADRGDGGERLSRRLCQGRRDRRDRAAEALPGVKVFQAGTARRDGTLVANGGRVLNVTRARRRPSPRRGRAPTRRSPSSTGRTASAAATSARPRAMAEERADRQREYSGTRAPTPGLAIDAARLAAYLEPHVPGFRGPVRISQFKGGQSNPTYLVEAESGAYVLRRKPPGKLLPSAHAIEREYARHGGAGQGRLPGAKGASSLQRPPRSPARPSTSWTVVAGRIVWEPAMPDSDRAERGSVYDAMNATLARLHGFDPAALGLADFGRGEAYVARQIRRWSEQYRASRTVEIAEMERLMEWLPARVPDQPRVSLVHGDFRLDNLILHPSRPRDRRGARLGALHARRSGRRLHLSPHAMGDAAHQQRRRPRLAHRPRPRRARHPAARAIHHGLRGADGTCR